MITNTGAGSDQVNTGVCMQSRATLVATVSRFCHTPQFILPICQSMKA